MKKLSIILSAILLASPVYSIDLNQEKIINQYNLPPEPDKKTNDSTLIGVDVNNNLIRDDVERKIVEKFYPNQKVILLLNQVAIANTLMHKAYANKDLDLYNDSMDVVKKVSNCLLFKENISDEDSNLYLVMIHQNTLQRLESLLKMDIYFSKLNPSAYLQPIDTDIDSKYC
jgi:hypothetical protein